MKRVFSVFACAVLAAAMLLPATASAASVEGETAPAQYDSGLFSIDPVPGTDPTPDYGGSEVTTDHDLVIDRTVIQTGDEFKYYYCLSYTVTNGAVRDLVLYDNLEDGTGSRFAGRLDSLAIECLSSDGFRTDALSGTVYYRTSSQAEADPGLEGSVLADPALSGANGTCWETAGTFVTGASGEALVNIPDGDVREIAVDFSGMRFTNADTVRVYLNMTHAGHPGNMGSETVLTNHLKAGYRLHGYDEPVVDSPDEKTTVTVKYKDSLLMPNTGGMGVVPVYGAGFAAIAAAAGWFVSRRKRED